DMVGDLASGGRAYLALCLHEHAGTLWSLHALVADATAGTHALRQSAQVNQVTVPKLFIHSRADGVVPFDMAEALWSASPEPKRHLWLDGVGHNETFHKTRNEASLAIREFLSSLGNRNAD